MRLGLIGHPLGHSWSPEIHRFLIDEDYELFDILPEELEAFLQKRDFDGLNVTIPYKEKVIPYLDEVDEKAKAIGAVNCIVNRDGRLFGYNTDYLGFRDMLEKNDVDLKGRNAAILGSGGASKAVREAVKDLGGIPYIVSRTHKGDLSYEELYEREAEFPVLINTTPAGMYPHIEEVPADLNRLTHTEVLVDIIANPLRTRLCYQASFKGIKTLGGVDMLVRQAFHADELFLNRKLDESLLEKCLDQLLHSKRNIAFIGMPAAGKTMAGRRLSEACGRKWYDMDAEIERKTGKTPFEIISREGEEKFREIESEVLKELSLNNGSLISCGGGTVLREENMKALAANSLIVRIDRDLSLLITDPKRPLSPDKKGLEELYRKRRHLYERYADITITNNGTKEELTEKLEEYL